MRQSEGELIASNRSTNNFLISRSCARGRGAGPLAFLEIGAKNAGRGKPPLKKTALGSIHPKKQGSMKYVGTYGGGCLPHVSALPLISKLKKKPGKKKGTWLLARFVVRIRTGFRNLCCNEYPIHR